MSTLFQVHAAAALCAIGVQTSTTAARAAGEEMLLEVVTTLSVHAALEQAA